MLEFHIAVFINFTGERSTIEKVQSHIDWLKKMFKSLKDAALAEIERAGISIATLVDKITSLPAPRQEQYKRFITKYRGKTATQLFLHCHWEYLNCDILGILITEFCRSLSSPCELVQQFAVYKRDLRQFMKHTTVSLFCKANKDMGYQESPNGFLKLYSRHVWRPPITLEKIDDFRRRFAYKYNLRSCTVFLLSLEHGSIAITMQAPESVELMIKTSDNEFFKEHGIVLMRLNDTVVYQEVSVHVHV